MWCSILFSGGGIKKVGKVIFVGRSQMVFCLRKECKIYVC